MLIAFRYIARRMGRTVLTVAGVALGAASYMALVAGGRGLEQQFLDAAKILGSELVVQQAGVTSPWQSAIPPLLAGKIAAQPGVATASRVVLGKTSFEAAPYFFVFGIEVSDPLLARLGRLEGRLPVSGADPPELLVGALAAEQLHLAPGDLVRMRRLELRVVGVYRTGRAILDHGAVLDLHTAQRLFNRRRGANILLLSLTHPEDQQAVLETLHARFPEIVAFPSSRWVESYGQVAVVGVFARFLALMALMIAVLGVSNVLHISVSERTRELAILRAIGWTPRRVASLVLADGVIVSVLGGLAGIPLAQALLYAAGSVSVAGYSAMGLIPLALPARVAMEGIVVSLLAGGAGTVLPVVHVLRMAPARALRSL